MSASELNVLRQAFPHRRWHRLMLVIALVITAIPIARALEFRDPYLLQVLAFGALILYWMLQFRLMQAAVYLSRLSGQSPLKIVYAVLRHHRRYVIATVAMMLSVSLALVVFLFYFTTHFPRETSFQYERGLLEYVGTSTGGYGWLPYSFPRGVQWIFIAFAGGMMTVFTLANSLLSISMGVWTGRVRRAVMVRIALLVIVSTIFVGLYTLRETPEWTCHRNWMIPSQCSDMLFQMRLVDSIQAMMLTFVDGGMAVLTGLFCPPVSRAIQLEAFQVRHFAVGIVTVFGQVGLSVFLLQKGRRWAGA